MWIKKAAKKEAMEPIKISKDSFDKLEATLENFNDIDPLLSPLAGRGGDEFIMVTDGSRWMGINPEGYDYPRYKTLVFYDEQAAYDAAQRGEFRRKHMDESFYKKRKNIEIEDPSPKTRNKKLIEKNIITEMQSVLDWDYGDMAEHLGISEETSKKIQELIRKEINKGK